MNQDDVKTPGAGNGDRIRIAYRCFDADGRLLEEAPAEDAPELVLGDGSVLEALEDALTGMKPGEIRQITLPPERAFGAYRDDLVLLLDPDSLPEGPAPQPGEWLELADDENEDPAPALVVAVEEDGIVVDTNHPLAGKTLRYELRLEAILRT